MRLPAARTSSGIRSICSLSLLYHFARRLKAKREQLKEDSRKYEQTEEDLKALQVRHHLS